MTTIRVIVCGGRNFDNYTLVKTKLDIYCGLYAGRVEIVSGACDSGTLTFTRPDGTEVYGADGLGERYAWENGLPVKYYPANWTKFGKAAGPLRNGDMAAYGTHCVAFWDGVSKGTRDMLAKADAHGLIIRKVMYVRLA